MGKEYSFKTIGEAKIFQGWNASFREGNNALLMSKKIPHNWPILFCIKFDPPQMAPTKNDPCRISSPSPGRIWLWLSTLGKISFLAVFAKFCGSTKSISQYNSGSNYQLKILMFYSKRKYIKTNQPYNSTWVRDCLHFKKPAAEYVLFTCHSHLCSTNAAALESLSSQHLTLPKNEALRPWWVAKGRNGTSGNENFKTKDNK